MGKIKKTLVLGGLLGAGLVWLTGTKKGKEVREQILDYSADIYMDVKKKVEKMDKKYNISKSAFTKMVKETADAYFSKNPMAAAVKDVILKTVVSQWEHLKEEAEDRVNDTKRAAKSVLKSKSKSKK